MLRIFLKIVCLISITILNSDNQIFHPAKLNRKFLLFKLNSFQELSGLKLSNISPSIHVAGGLVCQVIKL